MIVALALVVALAVFAVTEWLSDRRARRTADFIRHMLESERDLRREMRERRRRLLGESPTILLHGYGDSSTPR